MGVLLYNPATDRFLTVDPVPGGGANNYSYPTDPINSGDLNGQFEWWRLWRVLGFKVKGTHLKINHHRPAFHAKNHSWRVEWDRRNGWHVNTPGGRHIRARDVRARVRGWFRGGGGGRGALVRTEVAGRVRAEAGVVAVECLGETAKTNWRRREEAREE